MDVDNRAIQRVLSLAQARANTDASGMGEAHLMIFNRTSRKPWAEKTWRRVECYRGIEIVVWGC